MKELENNKKHFMLDNVSSKCSLEEIRKIWRMHEKMELSYKNIDVEALIHLNKNEIEQGGKESNVEKKWKSFLERLKDDSNS